MAIKEELETIDQLLKQLEEARKTAQIGIIDMEELSAVRRAGRRRTARRSCSSRSRTTCAQMAEQQGLERRANGFQLTPKAYRLFQGRLLERIFSDLQASRTGRHQGPIVGEGAVELQHTKPYEFGDSVANMDIPARSSTP